MHTKWKIDPVHNKILKKLFAGIKKTKKYRILDAGSGRTSLSFLAKRFPNSNIHAIIYPGDTRKRLSILESVTAKNYLLQEVDLHTFKQKSSFDIVLAHLLLGEANKFSKQSFKKMLDVLFGIKTKYLAIIDILDDPDVDYPLILKYIAKIGSIQCIVYEEKYIGLLLYKQ